MVKIIDMLKDDFIRICPNCGSVNLRQTPKPWDQKPGEVVVSQCMLCNHKSRDFPVIKKTVVKQFRDKLKNK